MLDVDFVPTTKAPASVERVPPATVTVTGTETQPTSEEITRRTYEAMGWAPPTPALELPPADPAAAVAPAPAPVAPAAPSAPPIAPIAPAMPDNRALIQETAREVATAVARAITPARPAAPATPLGDLELNADDAEDYKAVQFLEATDKSRAGLAKRFLDWLRALYDYEEKWLTENADKEFDANAAEHDEWYDRNPTPVERKDLDEAKIAMAAEKIYETRMAPTIKKIEDEQKGIKADRIWRESAPDVFLVANTKIIDMVRLSFPSMVPFLVDANGVASLGPDNAKRAEEHDPIAYEVLNVSAKRLWEMVVELEKTVLKGIDMKLTRANPVHATIIGAMEDEERRIMGTPADQVKNGKSFATIAQWAQLPEEERASRWMLTVDDMEALLVKTFAEQAKKSIEHLDNLGKKKYSKGSPPAQARPTAPPATAPAAPINTRKVQSPSISSASDIVTTQPNANAPQKSYGEQAVEQHFS